MDFCFLYHSLCALGLFRVCTYKGETHIIKKGQLALGVKSIQNQVKFIHQLFGMAA